MTFVSLSLFLGVETKRAAATAIAAGGWTSAFGFVVNVAVFNSVPQVRARV